MTKYQRLLIESQLQIASAIANHTVLSKGTVESKKDIDFIQKYADTVYKQL